MLDKCVEQPMPITWTGGGGQYMAVVVWPYDPIPSDRMTPYRSQSLGLQSFDPTWGDLAMVVDCMETREVENLAMATVFDY